MKEFVVRMIAKGRQEFVLDLGACELMDSTFMGMLTSVAFQLREVQSGQLRVVRANERNFSLLESLGLDHLFKSSRSLRQMHLARSRSLVRHQRRRKSKKRPFLSLTKPLLKPTRVMRYAFRT